MPLADGFDYLWTGAGTPPPAGARVQVAFGKGERVGIVLEHPAATTLSPDKLRPVLRPIDRRPVIGDELLGTLRWASEYYHHPIGEVVNHALPAALRKGKTLDDPIERAWRLTTEGEVQSIDRVARRARQQARCLELLKRRPCVSEADLRRAGLTSQVVKRLEAKAWIAPCTPDAGAARPLSHSGAAEPLPELTMDQSRVLDSIRAHGSGFNVFLLHGVTASGKTEIFLRLIREQLKMRRQTPAARAGNQPHAPARGSAAAPLRRATGGTALRAHGSGTLRRLAASLSAASQAHRRHALRCIRPTAVSRTHHRRRGARPGLQAGAGISLFRA